MDDERDLPTVDFSAEQIRQLYRLIDDMMDLPKRLGDLAWKEIRDFAKEKNMPFITGAERVGREEGLAEGRAKGLEEGRAKGLEEGLAQGRREAREDLMAGIEALLGIRFGAPGVALLPEVRRIEDLDLLRKIQ